LIIFVLARCLSLWLYLGTPDTILVPVFPFIVVIVTNKNTVSSLIDIFFTINLKFILYLK